MVSAKLRMGDAQAPENKSDLKAANILVEVGRDCNRRWIRFKKILKDSSKIDQYAT
jgi:hypothetical protein